MTSPYGNNEPIRYDKDGLPIDPKDPWANPAPHQQQRHQQPYPQYNYQQPYQQPQNFQQPYQQQYQQPPAQQPAYGAPQAYAQPKSQIAAALLALFLGTLGLHNFYLGHTRRGATQLTLSIVGWITSILLIGFVILFVVGAWALIEFVMILLRSGKMATDSRGMPLN